MAKKEAAEVAVDPNVEAIKAQGIKDVFVLKITHEGKELTGYLKFPDLNVKRKVFQKANFENDPLGAGEVILATCQVPGYGDDLYAIEPIRLECAVLITQYMEGIFNATGTLKKS